MKLLVWWLLSLAALCVLGAGLLASAGTLLLAWMPSVLPRLLSLSPGALLLLLPAPLLLLYLWRLLGAPLEILRAPEEVGYLPEPGRSLAQTASMVQRRRKKGDLPPVYPNGWYQVLLSRELPPGGARTATLLGEQVAVYRTQGGRVYVVDAYCPHLGANLAVGGRVVGDCIECPFHGWQFHGEDGKCTHVPYAEKVPDFAKIKTWPSCEVNDMIFVWYHCDGIEPAWKVPEQQKITSKEWVYRGRTEHFVNAHIEEIPENAADVAHLSFLHEPGIVTGTDLRYTKSKMWDFVKHGWKVQWIPELPPNKHCSQMLLVHELLLFGKHLPVLDFHVVARQIGPGIVHLTFKHSFLGTGVLLHTVTPVEPLMQKVTHLMYYQRSIPALIPKLILKAECIQFERDVMVWNNKKFVSKPLLLKEDAAVGRHRRWFSQFYTENSPRFSFQQDSLDW